MGPRYGGKMGLALYLIGKLKQVGNMAKYDWPQLLQEIPTGSKG